MPAIYNDYHNIKEYVKDYPEQLEKFLSREEFLTEENFISFELEQLEKYPKPSGRVHLFSEIKFFLQSRLKAVNGVEVSKKTRSSSSKPSATNVAPLSQKQYTLLIYYFTRSKMFLPKSSLKLYCDFISDLSGLSVKQLYKDSKSITHATDITENGDDFIELSKLLEGMIAKMKDDMPKKTKK